MAELLGASPALAWQTNETLTQWARPMQPSHGGMPFQPGHQISSKIFGEEIEKVVKIHCTSTQILPNFQHLSPYRPYLAWSPERRLVRREVVDLQGKGTQSSLLQVLATWQHQNHYIVFVKEMGENKRHLGISWHFYIQHIRFGTKRS